jgi:hypothetical protein
LLPTCVSINPDGKVAAVADRDTKASEAAIRSGRIDFKLECGMWKDRCDFIDDYGSYGDSTRTRNQGVALQIDFDFGLI